MDRAVLCIALLPLLCGATMAATNDGGHGHHDNDHGHHHGNGHHGCRECQSCRRGDDWCYKHCKKSCGSTSQQGVDIEACKRYGNDKGAYAAKQACDTTMLYCKGGSRSFGAPPSRGAKVSLAQCGNAAYGVCQNKAMDAKQSPCGSGFNGINQCTKDAFMKFYTAEVDWWCNSAVAEFDKKP